MRPLPIDPVPAAAAGVLGVAVIRGVPTPVLRLAEVLGVADRPVIVLHINEPFGSAFAEWLDAQTTHRVAFAKHGEPLSPGVAMAPPDHHLTVVDGRLHLSRGPERHSCRPSVDVLFESLAADLGAATIACLLTGMGRDGATGLRQIRDQGGITIAQDEASCVVFGMPREAILLGAASRVLPLDEIGPTVSALVEEGA